MSRPSRCFPRRAHTRYQSHDSWVVQNTTKSKENERKRKEKRSPGTTQQITNMRNAKEIFFLFLNRSFISCAFRWLGENANKTRRANTHEHWVCFNSSGVRANRHCSNAISTRPAKGKKKENKNCSAIHTQPDSISLSGLDCGAAVVFLASFRWFALAQKRVLLERSVQVQCHAVRGHLECTSI